MCEQFRKGDLYWDREKQVLVIPETGTCPPKAQMGTVTAMAIPLDKAILDVLGFHNNGISYEDDNGHFISETFDTFEFNGKVVVYLNDLLNAFEDSGETIVKNDEIIGKLIDVLRIEYPPITLT